MRYILLIAFYIFLLNSAIAQTISPSRDNEYCPGVEYTFTATLTQPYSSMIGEGCYITQLPTNIGGYTITFKGKFADANTKQTFKIFHPGNTNNPTLFEFKKIKSLFYASCGPIQPNQGLIVAPRCQIVNIPVSFNNIQWSTAFEIPSLCFGSITTYEYLLPIGWSIGTKISNGSDWILEDNNVTITSDLGNGVDGRVYIRPANNCGPGLSEGQSSMVSIPILREKPALSITGNQSAICSGCEIFNINGMPVGATIQWSLSNSDASISGCTTCNTVSVCRNSSANTTVLLNASVSHCSFTYPVQYTIALGTPAPETPIFMLIDPIMGKLLAKTDPVPGATQYKWYKNGQLFTYPGGGTGSDIVLFPIPRTCDVSYNIAVEVVNACGVSSQAQSWVYVPCDNYFKISPNPTQGDVFVTIDENKLFKSTETSIEEIKIYDLQGNLKKYQKYNKIKNAKINTGSLKKGIYMIEIINGRYKEIKQLIIQK